MDSENYKPLGRNPPKDGGMIVKVSFGLLVWNAVIVTLVLVFFPASRSQLDNAFCSNLCGRTCIGVAHCYQPCFANCRDLNAKTPSELSASLIKGGIQHVGLTVSNLTRSVDFYVRILGGVEVASAGGDGWNGDDVQQLLMQHELIEGEVPKGGGVADLNADGTDTLAARYVNFGSWQLELLYYHPRNATAGSTLPHWMNSTAPSIVNSYHLAFLLEPHVGLDSFVNDLEAKSHAAGYSNVKCNRIKPVKNEAERAALGKSHPEYNSFKVSSGPFEGWQLAYCKGPDGEQLEFNHQYAKAGVLFEDAMASYMSGKQKPIW